MKNLTWQNPEQLFVAQELINKVKSKCCGIKDSDICFSLVFPDYGGSWRYYPPKVGVDSKNGKTKCYAPGRLYSEYDYKELTFSTYWCASVSIKYALKKLDKNIDEILARKAI